MNKTMLTKLALERCGFYLSQLLAHIHLADMATIAVEAPEEGALFPTGEACMYGIIAALKSDLKMLETLIEE